MGPVVAAAIPAVASLVGGLFGMQGGHDANQANAKQAQLNRDFQERMSSTAFQRGVEDLKKAGLNPALAYGHGGASSPGGATAAPANNALQNIGQGVTGAGQAFAQGASIAHTMAQIEKTRSETASIDLDRRITEFQSQWRTAILMNDSERAAALAQLYKDPLYPIMLKNKLLAEIDATETHADVNAANARALSLQMPGLENASRAEQTFWGRYVRPYLNDAKSVAGIAGNLTIGGAISGAAGRIFRSGKTVGPAKATRRAPTGPERDTPLSSAEQQRRIRQLLEGRGS